MSTAEPESRKRPHPLLLACVVVAVLGAAVGIFFSIHHAARAVSDPVSNRALDPAIRQVLEDQVAAWNRGDLNGFMVGYWNSPDLTYSSTSGTKRGHQELLQHYQARYQAEGRSMGQLSFGGLEGEMLGPDVALVRGRWKVVTGDKTQQGRFKLMVRRLPEGWRIVHDYTT
jgi:ketosteroid isomerase-like protein